MDDLEKCQRGDCNCSRGKPCMDCCDACQELCKQPTQQFEEK